MAKNVDIKVLSQDSWQKDNGVIPLLVTGRVSYPNLWKPSLYEGVPVNYLSCNALLEGATPDQIKQLKLEILKAARHYYPKVKYDELVNQKLVCDEDGVYSLKMRTGMDKPPLFVTTKTRSPIKSATDTTGKLIPPFDPEKNQSATETLYPGCWAMFKITLSGDNKKKKVWVNIQAVRFVADGPRFGGDGLNASVEDMGDVVVDEMGGSASDGLDDLGEDLDDGLGEDLDDGLGEDLDDGSGLFDDLDDDIPF